MGIGKIEFIERYGGIRLGESSEQLKSRISEIDELELKFRSGSLNMIELEAIQRRLCDLKGINFDDDDDESY